MNERIQQLAEQAGFVDYMVLNRIESKEEVLENFAKLIVKEHINLIRQEWVMLNDQDKFEDELNSAFWAGRKSQCNRMMALISKHFGIE